MKNPVVQPVLWPRLPHLRGSFHLCLGGTVPFLVHYNDRFSGATLQIGMGGRGQEHLTFIVFCLRRNKKYSTTIDKQI